LAKTLRCFVLETEESVRKQGAAIRGGICNLDSKNGEKEYEKPASHFIESLAVHIVTLFSAFECPSLRHSG
jgi:hypothetical protein